MNKAQYLEYLKSDIWKRKAEGMKKGCGHRCQVCDGLMNLQVHHRSYERVGKERRSDLIALCNRCHSAFHKNLPRYGQHELMKRLEKIVNVAEIAFDMEKRDATKEVFRLLREHVQAVGG